jgi:hypothetical protein
MKIRSEVLKSLHVDGRAKRTIDSANLLGVVLPLCEWSMALLYVEFLLSDFIEITRRGERRQACPLQLL